MWRNFFENSATVQADHRALALTTTAAALGMFLYARRGAGGGALWTALPPAARVATSTTAGLVTAQASSRHSKKYVTTDVRIPVPEKTLPYFTIVCLRLLCIVRFQQATLGVTTLLHCAPMHMAAAHQAGALTVLASSIWTAHTMRSFVHSPVTPPVMPSSYFETSTLKK